MKEQNVRPIWDRGILPRFAPLLGNRRCDVLIIGGGLTGLLVARRLTDAGLECLVAEAGRIMGGVSGSTTAKITAQHGMVYADLCERIGKARTAAYLHYNLAAVREYERLSQNADIDYQKAPSTVYLTRDTDGLLVREHEALRELGYEAELLSETELPFPVAGAIRFREQAVCDPILLARALLPGVRVCEHTRVREIRDNLAITDCGRISADSIVVTTHFPYLNKRGLYPLKMYQQRSYVLALRDAFLPQDTYIDGTGEGLSFRRHRDLLLLGGGGHRTGRSGGGWDVLTRFAERYLPTAREVCRFAAQDCMTLDGLPYVGRYGRYTPGLYVATGFGKWGLTNGMAAAMLLTDLLTGKRNGMEKVLSPSRLMPVLPTLKNLASSAYDLMTPGKRCPHMGCALRWNREERSWDCPCHGSRFSEKGRLLDGPATGDLPYGCDR